MIARLTGELASVEANTVIVDVHGVGYKVTLPVSTLGEVGALGSKVTLHVHTHVVEDDIALYGFSTAEQQKSFEMLIGVNGIGPKVALSILSSLDTSRLAQAVASEDVRSLTRVPGLGIKTAQRLILELKEKMAVLAFDIKAEQTEAGARQSAREKELSDVIDGLVNLGYNRNEARKAADRAAAEAPAGLGSASLLRAALNFLTGGGKA
jgi:Holliday junction DNA helicase RuvA